jgi:hypothetical protein
VLLLTKPKILIVIGENANAHHNWAAATKSTPDVGHDGTNQLVRGAKQTSCGLCPKF